MKEFVIHACEQSLRFSSAPSWEELSEKIRMQFSFNVGVMSLGLDLTKEDGYDTLKELCLGEISMNEYHTHIRKVVAEHAVPIDEAKVAREF